MVDLDGISSEAFDDIIRYEVSSQAVYARRYRQPTWPGEQSGVGHDVGQASRRQFVADWSGRIDAAMVKALAKCCGVTGPAARQRALDLRESVDVAWDGLHAMESRPRCLRRSVCLTFRHCVHQGEVLSYGELNNLRLKMNPPQPGFWSTLAGVRFLLALWVLFDHTYNFGPADRAIPVLTKSGLMAVMCFFVISGFSIHHSIRSRPEGYLRRRFWRIFPLNALAVFIGWFAWSVLGLSGGYGTPQIPPTPWDFIGCLFLLEVVFPVMVPFLYPAWSLSIEALYYVCAPLFKRIEGTRIFPVLIIGSGVFFVAWPFIRDEYIAARYSYEFAAMAMLWAWLAGWVAYRRPGDVSYLAALIAGGLVGIWSQAKFFAIADFASAAVTCIAWVGVLLVVFYRFGKARGVAAHIFDYLGELSFPLYLLHYPVLFVVTSSIFRRYPNLNYGFLQVLISLVAAMLAYRYVDKPLRAFGTSGDITGKRSRSSAVVSASITLQNPG